MRHAVALLVSVVSVLALSQTSRAGFMATFAGSDSGLSASVTFGFDSNGNLTATLSNTGVASGEPTQVLTGLYFNTSNGQSGLDVTSVAMASGSSAKYVDSSGTVINQQIAGTDVGGEWASGAGPAGFTYGVAAAGLDSVFGSGTVVGGHVLQDYFNNPPNDVKSGMPPDGATGGLVNSIASTNGGIQTRAFVQNSVVITFSGFSGDGNNITGVRFVYGTSSGEVDFAGKIQPGVSPVPAPPTAILALLGLPGFVAAAWARRRRVAVA